MSMFGWTEKALVGFRAWHFGDVLKVDNCMEADRDIYVYSVLIKAQSFPVHLQLKPTRVLWLNIRVALLTCKFVWLLNWLESSECHLGKWLTNCMLFSRWMWPLSHGDVTFQQEAQGETLSEDFVPPGCMAECWVQGCWPRHRFISASAGALRSIPYPRPRHCSSTKPATPHTALTLRYITLLCLYKYIW